MCLQSAALCWDSSAEFHVTLLRNTVKQSQTLCPGQNAKITCTFLILLTKHLHLNLLEFCSLKCCNDTLLARLSKKTKQCSPPLQGRDSSASLTTQHDTFIQIGIPLECEVTVSSLTPLQVIKSEIHDLYSLIVCPSVITQILSCLSAFLKKAQSTWIF